MDVKDTSRIKFQDKPIKLFLEVYVIYVQSISILSNMTILCPIFPKLVTVSSIHWDPGKVDTVDLGMTLDTVSAPHAGPTWRSILPQALLLLLLGPKRFGFRSDLT